VIKADSEWEELNYDYRKLLRLLFGEGRSR
jgi:hypothetical protein